MEVLPEEESADGAGRRAKLATARTSAMKSLDETSDNSAWSTAVDGACKDNACDGIKNNEPKIVTHSGTLDVRNKLQVL